MENIEFKLHLKIKLMLHPSRGERVKSVRRLANTLLIIAQSKVIVPNYVPSSEFGPYWMPQITAYTFSYL